eukprot:749684-Hanusia_phi.AAC.5
MTLSNLSRIVSTRSYRRPTRAEEVEQDGQAAMEEAERESTEDCKGSTTLGRIRMEAGLPAMGTGVKTLATTLLSLTESSRGPEILERKRTTAMPVEEISDESQQHDKSTSLLQAAMLGQVVPLAVTTNCETYESLAPIA